MRNISPLGALVAIVILGVTIEVVERQNRTAAYVLVVVLLLGMITFNAGAFNQQVTQIIAMLNAPSRTQDKRAQAVATATPVFRH